MSFSGRAQQQAITIGNEIAMESGGFSPGQLGAKMTAWLRAPGIAGSPIDSWTNDALASGGGSWTQSLTARPAVATVGGISPCAAFDGVNDQLLGGNNASSYMTTTALEIAMVVQAAALGGADSLDSTPYIRPGLFSSVTGATVGASISPSGVKFWTFNGTTYNNTPFASLATGSPQLIRMRLDSGNVYVRVGSGTEQSATSGGAISSLASALRIGANFDATAPCAVTVAEMVICNAVLSASERGLLGQYLGSRFGCAS